jgi:hypothetical protein
MQVAPEEKNGNSEVFFFGSIRCRRLFHGWRDHKNRAFHFLADIRSSLKPIRLGVAVCSEGSAACLNVALSHYE